MLTREKLQKAVIEKAATDPVFKKQLMANPNLTLKKLLKEFKGLSAQELKVFEKTNFKVQTEKTNEIVLLLPHEVMEQGMLSHEELEKVAGAGCVGGWWNAIK